ncbi:MAG: hypothetical protein PHF29_00785 [Candidatus Riflebacteria bacterium]|nr:hypothetical protein [Candidatus Riflebacteria bacterium]
MKNYIFITLIMVLISCSLFANDFKGQIKDLLRAVKIASFGFEVSENLEESFPEKHNTNFEAQAALRLELAIIGINPQLMKEDYFNLAIYALSREKKQFEVALKALKTEEAKERYRPLKNWLNKRAEKLAELCADKSQNDDDYDITKDFDSILKLLP